MYISTATNLRKIAGFWDSKAGKFIKNMFRFNPGSTPPGNTIDISGGAIPQGMTTKSKITTNSFKSKPEVSVRRKPDVSARSYSAAEFLTPKDAYLYEYNLADLYRFGDMQPQSELGTQLYEDAMRARAAAWGLKYKPGTFYPVKAKDNSYIPEGFDNPRTYGTYLYRNTPQDQLSALKLPRGAAGVYVPSRRTLSPKVFNIPVLLAPKKPEHVLGYNNTIYVADPRDSGFSKEMAESSTVPHEVAHAATPGIVIHGRSTVAGFPNSYTTGDGELFGQLHSLKALYTRVYKTKPPKSLRQAVNQLVSDGYLNANHIPIDKAKIKSGAQKLPSLYVVGDKHPSAKFEERNPKYRGVGVNSLMTQIYANFSPFLDYFRHKEPNQDTDRDLDYYWQQANRGGINKRISDTA